LTVCADPYCNAQLRAFQRASAPWLILASSGAIGRLVPEDVAGLARYLRDHASASAEQAGISY
jgi:hypothetical protein